MLLRRVACAVAVLALSVGIAMAEDIRGRITKVEDGKITFQNFVKFDKETKKAEYGDAKTYSLAKDVKVQKSEKKKKVELEGGLKASIFKDIDEKKGVGATITVEDGKVTEITVGGGKKKAAN